jgi:hypothetical protein
MDFPAMQSAAAEGLGGGLRNHYLCNYKIGMKCVQYNLPEIRQGGDCASYPRVCVCTFTRRAVCIAVCPAIIRPNTACAAAIIPIVQTAYGGVQ